MFCAHKDDALEFAYWEGVDARYPDWLACMIHDSIIAVEYGTAIYYSEAGEIALSPGDVFLRNKLDMVMWMDSVHFHSLFYTCD